MITLARDGMRTDLERMWRVCFNDPDDYIKYFFDYRYDPNCCAVYIDENIGRPVAMLHMLDASITEDSEIVPVQYIYAAATRPDYQNRGIMGQLIDFARRYAYTKRQKYMILVPGTRELFRFYENRGFHRCFRIRDVYMTRRDLMSLSDYKKQQEKRSQKAGRLSLTDIHAVRRDILVDREGFVTWDYQAFKYAAGIHEQSGGIIVTATNGVDAGYAFCRKSEDGVAHVTEFIAHSGFSAEVIRNMLDVCDSERYEFRVPVFDEFFSPFGEVNDYGMIAAVNGRTPINILTLKGTHLPYLGLALD